VIPPAATDRPPAAGDPAVALTSYCELSGQVDDLESLHPEQPRRVVDEAGPRLEEMIRVAPGEIRDAVATRVADLRATGGVPGVSAPDEAALERAETTIDAFEEKSCRA
jgi:hypothetical protein